MLQMILFFLFFLLMIGAALRIIWLFIMKLTNKHKSAVKITSMKRTALFFLSSTLCASILTMLSQWTVSTPAIRDEHGEIPADGISELISVPIRGTSQWISIRGIDQKNPVLLFLAGGPGGTQMAAVRHELAELENHFIVVNWDQPGSGKSFSARTTKHLTPETYVQDGYALTQYLLARFNQQKIYLVGESWGSALGIFLIARYPQYYHAFIGTGQMIDFTETERMDYAKAMEIAKEKKDIKFQRKLQQQGLPPYYGKDSTWKSAAYLNYLSSYMAENSEIHNPGYHTIRDIMSSEYGILDKLNFFRGLLTTYTQVYPQLYGIDLRAAYTKLDVPIYFFEGRHDVNAPPVLVESYMEVLDAPLKELIWFEHSGHSPWINERDLFIKELLVRFQFHK